MYRRTAELLGFELATTLPRLKGMIFLLPYGLFWFVLLRSMHGDVADFMQRQEGLALASLLFEVDQVRALFVNNPPLLSLHYVIGLSTLPLFAILAGMDQFAGDLGRGWFQLLATRCRRGEVFLARYTASLLTLSMAIAAVTIAATILSLAGSDRPPAVTLQYGLQTGAVMILYGAALLAFVALISVMTRSAIGALFLSLLAWITILAVAAVLNAVFPEPPLFQYLLPSGLKPALYRLDGDTLLQAALGLPAYTLVYGWLAWRVFSRSRL